MLNDVLGEPKPDPADGRRVRVLPVSSELLRQALKLPEGVEFVDVMNDFVCDRLLFEITHPAFPVVKENEQIPRCDALYAERRVVEFQGWG